MEVSKYMLLFHKKLKGKISPQEQSELSNWLQEESRQGLADEMQGLWELSGRYKQGYEPDTEAGLAGFRSRIAAARSRQRKSRLRVLRLLSAAAALALLLVAGWWWGIRTPDTGSGLVYHTAAGQAKEVFLPDGSRVLLNENSHLSLSESFTASARRRAELSGEAYFDVKPDPGHPFVITTTDARVEILGTAFNLRAYPSEGFTEVEVEEGKVRLAERSGEEALELRPGERGICKPGQPLQQKRPPALNAHSWRTGRLAFRKTPLKEAMPALERHFGVDIELGDSEVADCTLTMSFEKSSLEEVLEALKLIFHFDIDEAGNKKQFILRAGNCTPDASSSE